MALRSAREKRGETECGHVGQSWANRITRAPDLATQRERSPELDSDLRPRFRAPARVRHHAQDSVDAEPRVPEAGVVHTAYFPFGPRGSTVSGMTIRSIPSTFVPGIFEWLAETE
jgi:hypothetical protein